MGTNQTKSPETWGRTLALRRLGGGGKATGVACINGAKAEERVPCGRYNRGEA